MKALLNKYIQRLDAISPRERILVLVAGIGLVLAVVFLIGIAPSAEKARALSARSSDQKNQLVVANAQKAELERTLKLDPDVALRQRIAERRRVIAEIDTELAGLQRTLVSPESMASVLEQMVGQDRRVRIVRLKNLPAAPLVEKTEPAPTTVPQPPTPAGTPPAVKPPADAAAAAKAKSGDGDRHVFKHGVEITVEGSYLDVLAYVARLEKQPWQVYWGRTVMSADYPKVQVELTLYTLSLDRSWLVV